MANNKLDKVSELDEVDVLPVDDLVVGCQELPGHLDIVPRQTVVPGPSLHNRGIIK